MENWFENEWPYSKEAGERFTKMHKEDGFTSRKEYEAYAFVDSIISSNIMEIGIPKEQIEKALYAEALIPTKKEEKLKLYKELNLTYVLEKALTSSEDELDLFRKEFSRKLIENLSQEELEEKIQDYESLVNQMNKNINKLQQRLEEKRNRHL